MAHQDKGKYFKKHPEGTKVAEDLKQEILKQVKDNNIACKAAEKIAQKTNVPLSEIGVGIDLLNFNIVQCQLGLFGFDGKQKRVPAAATVAPDLEAAIRTALVNNRLSCVAAWTIADKLGVKRLDVCAACENLQIKVKPCQLGAF
ncbi:MAG TPA: hypothetical protein P5347_00185 [Smithellaceae bacterium]|nr:hypothetical protein [Smithellaceae bacterium]HPE06345.1 hypothetical protein [Smithellaceae bacterium]HRY37117.1 hypothetical protein [Smithellaceae bacterium]